METVTVQIRSPFKFLDPFGKDDTDIFFGRDDEQEKLYQYVNKNRLVLVYGPSGAGKTSLVQCGLANRFDITDWLPFFIRRGSNINLSLRDALLQSKALGNILPDEGYHYSQVVKAIERISTRYLRPVYLIFDQFEELLILGDPEEKDEFMRTLDAIISSEGTQSCNLLFVLREEYFAWLDPFEQAIPGFSDRRLRIEPMRPTKIKEVIKRSCECFRITLEDPDRNAQQIVRILSGKTGISLPYLQVYLDQLWREDFKRTYPDGCFDDTPALEFTTKEIEDFGQIKDVLERFLFERKKILHQELARRQYSVTEDFVDKLLDSFVTDEGTRLPVFYSLKENHVYFADSAPDYLRQLPVLIATTCLQELERSRIIRSDGESFELAHDILAALIDQQRSDEQRKLNDLRNQIRSSYQTFKQTQEYLSSKQVAIYEDAIGRLKLDEKLVDFFQKSKQESNRKLEEAEKTAREQRELRKKAEQSNLLAQNKAKTAKIRSRIAFGLALLCLSSLVYSFYQNSKLRKSEESKQNQLARHYWEDSQTAGLQNNFLDALHFTAEALSASRDTSLDKNLLLGIDPYLPSVRLTSILSTGNSLNNAVFSSNGKQILTAGKDSTARLWDVSTSKQVGPALKHEGTVYDAIFSPDGKRILTASGDSTARLWDASTGQQIGPAMKHDHLVYHAVFSPSGKQILTASWDGTARLWDAVTCKQIQPALKHGGLVMKAVFSPDGELILTLSSDHTALLWHATTGQRIGLVMQHDGVVYDGVFSSDGKQILTASWDGAARLWEASTGQRIGAAMEHTDAVYQAVFSPDRTQILTASWDQTARLWEAGTGKQIGRAIKHENGVTSAVFSPDGKRILTVSEDDAARLWDVATNKQIGPPLKHGDVVTKAIFSPNGKQILTASWDGTVHVWEVGDVKYPNLAMEHDGVVNDAVFSPDTKRILTSCSDGTARLWDAATGKQIAATVRNEAKIFSGVFSPDGRQFLTVGADSTIRLWDAVTFKQVSPAMKHFGKIYTAVFSPDGKEILTASADSTARVWDAAAGAQKGPYMKHKGLVCSAVFSPDGKQILTASFDMTACLWDATTRKQIGTVMKHNDDIMGAVFSPDGHQILTASRDGLARLWAAQTGKEVGLAMKHGNGVAKAIFTPDGKKILTVSADKTARLWEAGTGKQLGPAMKHANILDNGSFSPDAKRILTLSFDSTVCLWDALTGRQIGFALKGENVLKSAVFSPDGKQILTASSDRTARLWNIEADLDLSVDLFKQQAQAITGCELNPETHETQVIPAARWYSINKDYNEKAKEHYKSCKYPECNLWSRFFPSEARKMRPDVDWSKRNNISTSWSIISTKKKLDDYIKKLDVWQNQAFKGAAQINFEPLETSLNSSLINNAEIKQKLTTFYGNCSWYLLFVSKFKEAEQCARKGLNADSSKTWIKTNLAHALLFQKRYDEALVVYRELSHLYNEQKESYAAICIKDLDELEKEGIRDKEITKVRALLKQGQLESKSR